MSTYHMKARFANALVRLCVLRIFVSNNLTAHRSEGTPLTYGLHIRTATIKNHVARTIAI